MTTLSIHQPNYIPWLGYFFKISQSDIFVFLDDVQYSNKGMHNYHYIKTPQGSFRLKIPVNERFGDKINAVITKDETGWKEKHLKILESNYKRAKYFNEIFNDFTVILNPNYQNIAQLNTAIIKYFCHKLEIKSRFIESSSLEIKTAHEERILDICIALNADVYCSGIGAKSYQKEENFSRRGIQLNYCEFKPFDYLQLWGAFQSNVTIIDYLMNCGYDWQRVAQSQKNMD